MSTAGTALPGDAGLVVFFLVGLLGGAHCLGMCGPLVTVYGDRIGGKTDRVTWLQIRRHALFNLGRTVGYAVVGAVMGLLGALLFDAAGVVAATNGVRAVVGIAVGGFVLLVGGRYLLGGPGGEPDVPLVGAAFRRVSGWITPRLDALTAGPQVAALGVVHAALPCPLLYPAYLYALALGSPARGALSLAALGAGTFPLLFAYGTAFGSLSRGTRIGLHRALGVAFLALGYLPLSHGLALLGVPVPHVEVPIYQPLG